MPNRKLTTVEEKKKQVLLRYTDISEGVAHMFVENFTYSQFIREYREEYEMYIRLKNRENANKET